MSDSCAVNLCGIACGMLDQETRTALGVLGVISEFFNDVLGVICD